MSSKVFAARQWVRLRSVALFGALLSFALLPIVWVILTSLKKRLDIFVVPPRLIFKPNFEAYQAIFKSSATLGNLVNSVIVSVGAALLTLVCASLAAYAFSRFNFPGRQSLLLGILGTRLMPPVTIVIPLFLLFNNWHLIDTHLGLILIYSSLNVPLATWMMKSFFDSVPRELEQAAMVDGTTAVGALFRITLPLASPGLAATAVFIFTLAWNEFMFAYIFTTTEARTLPVLLSETLGELQVYWTEMAALATLIILPPLLFSFFMQRYLVTGLRSGAIK